MVFVHLTASAYSAYAQQAPLCSDSTACCTPAGISIKTNQSPPNDIFLPAATGTILFITNDLICVRANTSIWCMYYTTATLTKHTLCTFPHDNPPIQLWVDMSFSKTYTLIFELATLSIEMIVQGQTGQLTADMFTFPLSITTAAPPQLATVAFRTTCNAYRSGLLMFKDGSIWSFWLGVLAMDECCFLTFLENPARPTRQVLQLRACTTTDIDTINLAILPPKPHRHYKQNADIDLTEHLIFTVNNLVSWIKWSKSPEMHIFKAVRIALLKEVAHKIIATGHNTFTVWNAESTLIANVNLDLSLNVAIVENV